MSVIPAGDWLTASEVAKMHGLSVRRVQQAAKNGEIPALHNAFGVMIRRADAEAFAGRRGRGRPKKGSPVARPGKRKRK
jgi:hypothetical protein